MFEIIQFFRGRSRKTFTLKQFQHLTNAVMGSMHVIFLILFWVTDVKAMFVVNLFSVATYVLAYYISGGKSAILAFRLVYYEVLIHLVLVTIMIGDKCGFGLYCMALVPVTYYFYYLFREEPELKSKDFDPLFFSLLSMFTYVSLKFYTAKYGAVYDDIFLTDNEKVALFTFNFCLVMLALIGFMGTSIVQYLTMQDKLEKYATEDPLTGLMNRRSIIQRMETAYANGDSFSVIMCDIDNFKLANDTYGHECGDSILQMIAGYLKSKKVHPADIVSRWGGEEILIFMMGVSKKEAVAIAEEMRKGVTELSITNREATLHITMTLGVAESSEKDTYIDLVHLADQRLYVGKNSGKNRVVCEVI